MDRITRYRDRVKVNGESFDILRDWDVVSPNVYVEIPGRGQGSDTVWYNSVPEARAAVVAAGKVPTK